MFEKEIAAFRAELIRVMKDEDRDRKRPVKKSKRLEIRVTERKGKKADLELFYDEQFKRMFGQHDTVRKDLALNIDLKQACSFARELKKQLPTFSISFLEYQEIEYIM